MVVPQESSHHFPTSLDHFLGPLSAVTFRREGKVALPCGESASARAGSLRKAGRVDDRQGFLPKTLSRKASNQTPFTMNMTSPEMRRSHTRNAAGSLLISKTQSLNPLAPQGAVPGTHQAHQDRLGISLAEPFLKAVHWNPRPAAFESLGLICFFSLPGQRAPSISISVTYHA